MLLFRVQYELLKSDPLEGLLGCGILVTVEILVQMLRRIEKILLR